MAMSMLSLVVTDRIMRRKGDGGEAHRTAMVDCMRRGPVLAVSG
jgi:hypothetical protein